MRDLTTALAGWAEKGGCEIGEVRIMQLHGAFELCHHADYGQTDLRSHEGAEAARVIANYDEAGRFRPLKTAPNLKRGWMLHVTGLEELRRALDFFYPAMLGVWVSHCVGELAPVPLRETLGRQTGMYRVTQKLTDDQAQALIGEFCRSDGGCLKHLLWRISPDLPIRTLPAEKLLPEQRPAALPLLCHEACNLLVAQARAAVKKAETPG